ncbi:hypothetical protein BDR04DRAFT_1130902 [Suillus decipiens]|nr:hypothetical protein BDR04DRAFT_1130902 [Suillus decipiens]
MAYNIAGETLTLTDDEDEDNELQRRLTAILSVLVFVGAEQSCYECSECWQTRRYLIHSDLLPNPHLNTPWQVLYSGQNDHMFITPILRNDISVTAHSCLVLHWLNSTMQEVSLMQIFALIPATVSCYLHFFLTILLCFGTLDGLNLPVQTSQDQEIKNATYNGWLHSHFVSSVIAFSADSALLTNTPDRYYLVTNTAFPQGTDQIAGHIKAPLKSGQYLPDDPAKRQKLLLFDWQLLSFWQMAEWGMHALQGSFGCLCILLNINFSE